MSNDTAIQSLKEKIDDLNQQAWEARVNDSQKAFDNSEESVKLARNINYPKGLAEGLRSLGFAYVRLFKNYEAAPLLRESLSLFQSLNDLKGQAIVYEYLGIIERNWGNLGASLEFLLKGNELSQQSGPLEIEITSCYQVGVTYKHLGNHENALDYLYKALSLSKKINFTLMEGYAINIIGSIYFDNGDYNHALDCYQQGLIIRQQSHDKWGEAGSMDNIGFTYLKLNDLDKAIDHCKQSLKITQSTGDKKGEANTLLHLAEIYQQAGNIGQASKFSNESLEIRKTRGDKRGEAEVLLFLADLHKQQSDLEDQQVFEWLSGALKIAEEIKAQDILSKACYNLHEYHTQKGNYKESLVQLEAHLQIEKELHKNTINQKISNLEISHKAETISQRNKELTELNDQIEKANEELKIEASLERVRAVAMGMKEPADMLHVCRMISDQLLQLGFKDIRNVQTVIIYQHKHEYLNYQYFTPYDKDSIEVIDYRLHPDVLEFTNQMLSSPNAYYRKTFEGEELKVWREYRKQTNQLPDPKLDEATSSHYYFYSIGSGALGVTTYASLSEKEISLFKRFRNVFELAYRRFVDIEKAQMQAREAKIETALEKVRSRSLAMHQSSELEEVIMVVSEQLQQLQFRFHNVSFVRYNEKKGLNFWLASPGRQQPFLIEVPYLDNPVFNRPLEAFKNGVDFIADVLTPEENHEWLKHLIEHSGFKNFSTEDKKNLLNTASYARSLVLMRHIILVIGNFAAVPYTEEQNLVLKRFANVFDQAYTRFLDLQKAEAQAREAKIEAALERTRTQSMIMQHSKELDDTLRVFHQQVLLLDINSAFSFLWLPDEKNDRHIFWAAWEEEKNGSTVFKSKAINYPLDRNEPATAQCLVDWKSNEPVYSYHVPPAAVENYFAVWQELIDGVEQLKPEYFSGGLHYVEAFMKYGCFGVMIATDLTEDEKKILSRFANEFERTYTRFLDLQKAEAQAREAQIEAGLERVRSRSMAMHNTSELQEVIHTVHKELLNLNIAINGGSFIAINKDVDTVLCCWGSGGTADTSEEVRLPLYEHPFCTNLINRIKSAPGFFTEEYTQKEKKDFFTFLFKHEPWSKLDAKQKNEILSSPGGYTRSCCVSQHTSIFIINHFGKKFSAADNDILQRFGKVFEQTYTRFLDLQKSEAQTREAQIEAGLERVRSRTMAMHKSDELAETAVVLFKQMIGLGIAPNRLYISIINDTSGDLEFWITDENGDKVSSRYIVNIHKNISIKKMYDGWTAKEKTITIDMQGKELEDWLTYWKEEFHVPFKPGAALKRRVQNIAYFSKGFIAIASPDDQPSTTINLLERFAAVFNLTYTRFSDLQQAEAQAREARIETALEKVRASTMAMQKSDDLSTAAYVLFQQFKELGESPERIFIATFDDDERWVDLWGTNQGGNQLNKLFRVPVDEPTVISKIVTGWKAKKKSIVIDLVGEDLNKYLSFLKDAGIPVTEGVMINRRVQTVACFSKGVIGVTTPEPHPQESVQLLERFAGVFDLTYTRFLDLTVAETKAHEARIEVALERVRARALAMQEPEELKDVAQVLRNEMGLLGVEELETSSIYIHPDNSEKVECWYALKDPKETGKRMISDHFELNLNETWVGREMQKFYISNDKQTSIVMQGVNRKEWIDYCYKHSPVFTGFYGETIPDRTYHLYKFSHGYIGAAAPGEISNESWRLLSRAASVFSLAYSRFKDLTQARTDLIKLKEEKKRAEDALTELQATQKQLIQSEKMASLGELTAGIAHEIQNPLNFVNNFSDVSNELLEEMKTELEKGNAEEAKAIAIDVKENLEKILHHGKRADAIVKGMLQHSRSSSGQKELTDINVLAEEYLRLAYHGLRAKDKFFNAKFETDLDPSISKINVVPQEIGRVILNLINNSFYAVSEKKRSVSNGYEPSVTVSTKKINDKVEIRVKDNGNGIPQKVLDKIFQPFFTTKPTGEGTGLGLSLSYDIVTKGHDGEIEVETKEGEGSAFIIRLPMK